ncbi:MAG: hypothetical protein EXR67_04535 [Dehalococcoidia bacterium]|nr:hypothetical protein [Dehalococcoidia bacterium]
MERLQPCPKCGGTLGIETEWLSKYLHCSKCGYIKELDVIAPALSFEPRIRLPGQSIARPPGPPKRAA